ncbi:MAG: class I SAM-dependent methyltransferase [Steroidobacteraceae bacterium]
MSTPWLDIPLEDYERHMALPEIGQATLIADQLAELVRERRPQTVAVMGCAGGNGFDRLCEQGLRRVIGVDINPRYLEEVRRRYAGKLPGLELYVADVQSQELLFAPVDLLYAALVFEYVDVPATLRMLRRHCRPMGTLATLTQMPHPTLREVSPSPCASLGKLESVMRLVAPEDLVREATRAGFIRESAAMLTSPAGKEFMLQVFRASSAA